MNKATEHVLEVLNKSGDWRSAGDIIVNINEGEYGDPPSRSTIYRALGDLTEYRYSGSYESDADYLIETCDFDRYGTYYRISELGEAFLDGEIDGGDFEPPDE